MLWFALRLLDRDIFGFDGIYRKRNGKFNFCFGLESVRKMVASAFDTLNIPVILGTIIFGAGVFVAFYYFSLRKSSTSRETKRKIISFLSIYCIQGLLRHYIEPMVITFGAHVIIIL